MATTSLWRIKGHISNVCLYVDNPDKTSQKKRVEVNVDAKLNKESLEDVVAYASRESATDDRRLVSGINCTPDKARSQMLAVKRKFEKEGGTIAYHGYQSFARGEVTPEQAHGIGVALAQELWGDKYQVLVATHLDKESHIHNHFVINTVSFVDGKKFFRSAADYRRMREVSDRICREQRLSVVRAPEGKRKEYSQWDAEKKGKTTFASMIRADIDRAIAASMTEREFFENLRELGYELKLRSEKTGKYLERPSLRPKNAKKFFRFDNLGDDYYLDEISRRILENYEREDLTPEETIAAVIIYRRKNPPHTKLTGFAALVYRYAYELHIIERYPKLPRVKTWQIQEDLKKLEELDRDVVFLAHNNISTLDELCEYRNNAVEERKKLEEVRMALRAELKQAIRKHGENSEEVKDVKSRIKDVSVRIKKIREEEVICDRVEERSTHVQKDYDDLTRQNDDVIQTKDERKVERDVLRS